MRKGKPASKSPRRRKSKPAAFSDRAFDEFAETVCEVLDAIELDYFKARVVMPDRTLRTLYVADAGMDQPVYFIGPRIRAGE